MLSYKLLKNHAGVLLTGDFSTLKALHEVVHDVNERSPIVADKEGSFLGLAYDARKAFERQREVIEPPEHYPEIGTRFGVQILWPILLVQCRTLRVSMAFFDTSKMQQAVAFNLEAVIESALDADFGPAAALLKELWGRIDPVHPWPEERLLSRGAIFCSWTKAERRAKLAGLLSSLDPMYPEIYRARVSNGDKSLVAPDELDAWGETEWQDPRW